MAKNKRIISVFLLFVFLFNFNFSVFADNTVAVSTQNINFDTNEYFRQLLTEKEKEYYDFLTASPENWLKGDGSGLIYEINYSALQDTQNMSVSQILAAYFGRNDWSSSVFNAVMKDHPEIFWVDWSKLAIGTQDHDTSAKTLKIKIIPLGEKNIYHETYENMADAESVIQKDYTVFIEKAKSIVAQTQQLNTEYEKLSYLNNWIVTHNKYASDTAFGTLDNRRTAYSSIMSENNADTGPVCVGYAYGYQLLCNLAGLKSVIVYGKLFYNKNDTTGVQHVWNRVQCDGNWYDTDTTWNDLNDMQMYIKEYFLVGTNTVAAHPQTNKNYADNHKTDGASYPALSAERYTLPNSDKEAFVNDTAYDTVEKAFENAQSGDIITLNNSYSKDIVIENTLQINKSDIHLDLNGKKLKINNPSGIFNPVLEIMQGGSLTVSDSSWNSSAFGTGEIYQNASYTVVVNNGEKEDFKIISGKLRRNVATNSFVSESKYTLGENSTETVTANYLIVKPLNITGIRIKTNPKTNYSSGEKFNPQGLIITVNYSDSSTKDVEYQSGNSSFVFTPSLDEVLTTDINQITVMYKEGTGYATAQIEITVEDASIDINESNFPDANFRNWLLNPSNINGLGADKKLSQEDISSITKIDVSQQNIASLKGIEYFTNLTYLNCNTNNISDLDISKNTKLKELYCSNNALSVLDLTNNADLEILYCASNVITDINLTNCTKLKSLNCEKNKLTQINLSANTELLNLYTRHNMLSQLDVSNNTKLKFIETFDNQLTSFDCSMLADLEFLHIDYNKLTTLDLSQNKNLKGNGFVVENNHIETIILPDIDNFTIETGAFYEQNEKIGYSTVKWYYDSQFTNEISFGSTVEANGQTIYAKWIANPYTVYYKANGGQGDTASHSTEYGRVFNIAANNFTKTGYVFSGWNTVSNGIGTAYAENESVSNLAGENPNDTYVNLYAQWSPITYTVVYDANGGQFTENIPNQAVKYDQSFVISQGNITKENYVFAGWSTKQNPTDNKAEFLPGENASNLTSNNNETVTLYAVWISNNDIQQVYIDQLNTYFDKLGSDNYYTEDFEKISEYKNTAYEAITNSGTDESAMQTALQTAVTNAETVKTKQQRVQEITDGWSSSHRDIISLINSVLATDNLTALSDMIDKAVNDNLENYSTLNDKANAVLQAKDYLKSKTESLNQMKEAVNWLALAKDLYNVNLQDVKSGSKEYAETVDKYNALSNEAKQYVDSTIINGLTVRQDFAREKYEALKNLESFYNSINLNNYTQENQKIINDLYENAKINIENADTIGMADRLYLECQGDIKNIKPIEEKKTPVISEKPAASSISKGQKLSESKLTGGKALVDNNAVQGNFVWKNPDITVDKTGEYTVVFVPQDTNKYNTVEFSITVTVKDFITPTPSPTVIPTPTASPSPSPTPTVTPSPTQAPQPTTPPVNNTPAVTVTPTAKPTPKPTKKPTATQTPKPANQYADNIKVDVQNGNVVLSAVVEYVEKDGKIFAVVSSSLLEQPLKDVIQQAKDDNLTPVINLNVNSDIEKAINLTLSKSVLQQISQNENAKLIINSKIITITFDNMTVKALLDQMQDDIVLDVVRLEKDKLNQPQQEAVGDYPVYEITLKSNDVVISDFKGAAAKVSIPYQLIGQQKPEGIVVWYIDDNAEKTVFDSNYNIQTNSVEFDTNHFSKYVIAYDETLAAQENQETAQDTQKDNALNIPLILIVSAVVIVAVAFVIKKRNSNQ